MSATEKFYQQFFNVVPNDEKKNDDIEMQEQQPQQQNPDQVESSELWNYATSDKKTVNNWFILQKRYFNLSHFILRIVWFVRMKLLLSRWDHNKKDY